MKGKTTDLKCLSQNYDIICLTETHLDDTFADSQIFNTDDKRIYRKDRNIHGGGVLIAVNSQIKHSPIILETNNEVIGVEIVDMIGHKNCFHNSFFPQTRPSGTSSSNQ